MRPHISGGLVVALLSLACRSLATPASPQYTEFKSDNFQGGLRYVKDSGVCETTPGVHTASGYMDFPPNQSYFFWFFEARENPEKAPFTLWINGGPACSSMIGLFQENGPCHVNADNKTTSINPYSWNSVSNMIYIDQPAGTGFSLGTEIVNNTEGTAPLIWRAFQLLFENPDFAKYKSRKFIFATESYGGKYGPDMVTYFDQQNAQIEAGKLKAERITVDALMINNGWFDPMIQFRSYIDFGANAPGYGPLVNESVIQQLNKTWFSPKGCLAQVEACAAAGNGPSSNSICLKADDACNAETFTPIVGDRDSDDLRQNFPPVFPSENYIGFLHRADIKAKIGAMGSYEECSDPPFNLFVSTGDDARSLLPLVAKLVDSKLKVLIWAGDADINCNWVGGHRAMLAMDWYGKKRLEETPFTNITIGGKAVAAVQNVDRFSFARVYESGHEVPAFQPEVALEIFKQVIADQQLHSVH